MGMWAWRGARTEAIMRGISGCIVVVVGSCVRRRRGSHPLESPRPRNGGTFGTGTVCGSTKATGHDPQHGSELPQQDFPAPEPAAIAYRQTGRLPPAFLSREGRARRTDSVLFFASDARYYGAIRRAAHRLQHPAASRCYPPGLAGGPARDGGRWHGTDLAQVAAGCVSMRRFLH